MDRTRATDRGRCPRLPRAGGDGPRGIRRHPRHRAAPPRRRGWTPQASRQSCASRGSPAQAGMDPVAATAGLARAGLPRAGGDGPQRVPLTRQLYQAPPRRRGWTPGPPTRTSSEGGSPAQAGMDPTTLPSSTVAGGLPRAGGDGPHRDRTGQPGARAPPRRRGWTRGGSRPVAARYGSPAQAGMDPTSAPRSTVSAWLPRAGGDGPSHIDFTPSEGAAPPRRRGWTLHQRPLRVLLRGSPAQAGMDRALGADEHQGRGLPRAGGDGPARVATTASPIPAPPRRRGWTVCQAAAITFAIGSPAQAGMDPRSPRPAAPRSWLPRAGGDGPDGRVGPGTRMSAPPRRRGWTPRRGGLARSVVGSPAQAGMDPSRFGAASSMRRLPRAGGDGPAQTLRPVAATEAPPRRRGWTHTPHGLCTPALGSPAQAGMDPAARAPERTRAGLPRAGGDGPCTDPARCHRTLAPPRRRGWTRATGEHRS